MSQLSRNILSMYLPRFGHIAVSIFMFPFIGGQVGYHDYGIWLLITSITALFVTDLGMGVSAIRYIADARTKGDDARVNRIVSSTAAFFLAVGAIAAALFGGGMLLALPHLNVPASDRDLAVTMIVLVAVATFLIGMPASAFRSVLAGEHRYDLINALTLVQLLLRCVLIVVLLLSGYGILAVTFVEFGLAILSAVVYFAIAHRLVPQLRVRPRLVDRALLRQMIGYSMNVFVISTAALVILQADNLIIGFVLPVSAVALYTAAFRIFQVCRDVTGSLFQPLIPDASRAQTLGDTERLRMLLVQGTKYTNGLALLISIPAIVFAEPILVAWVGEDFAQVAIVAQILVASLLINNNHLVATSLLMGTGRVRTYARLHVVWATTNVLLSIVLVHELGLKGMALGTAIPILCLEPLYIRFALKTYGVSARDFLRDVLARAYIPALVPGALLWAWASAVDPSSIVIVILASAVYGATFLLLFGRFGLLPAERARFLGWFKKRQRAVPEPA